jgi:hypothetical protein
MVNCETLGSDGGSLGIDYYHLYHCEMADYKILMFLIFLLWAAFLIYLCMYKKSCKFIISYIHDFL